MKGWKEKKERGLKDRVKEYIHERVAQRRGGSVWIVRGGGSSAMAIHAQSSSTIFAQLSVV